jgi:hypothetical protein
MAIFNSFLYVYQRVARSTSVGHRNIALCWGADPTLASPRELQHPRCRGRNGPGNFHVESDGKRNRGILIFLMNLRDFRWKVTWNGNSSNSHFLGASLSFANLGLDESWDCMKPGRMSSPGSKQMALDADGAEEAVLKWYQLVWLLGIKKRQFPRDMIWCKCLLVKWSRVAMVFLPVLLTLIAMVTHRRLSKLLEWDGTSASRGQLSCSFF